MPFLRKQWIQLDFVVVVDRDIIIKVETSYAIVIYIELFDYGSSRRAQHGFVRAAVSQLLRRVVPLGLVLL